MAAKRLVILGLFTKFFSRVDGGNRSPVAGVGDWWHSPVPLDKPLGVGKGDHQ